MSERNEQNEVDLRLSAQRALWGHVPPSLRAVSLEMRGTCIHVRAVFDPGATEEERELLSCAATEIIADFPAPTTIEEEFLDIAPPDKPQHLRFLAFLRWERPADEGGQRKS